MYPIDKFYLEQIVTSIIVRDLLIKDETDVKEKSIYYFNLTLSMIVDVLNSQERDINNAIEDQIDLYINNDPDIYYFAPIVHEIVLDAKTKFFSFGYDKRIKYKLYEKTVSTRYKLYDIGMDLDLTYETFKEKPESPEDINNVVSEHPSIDLLSALFERQRTI